MIDKITKSLSVRKPKDRTVLRIEKTDEAGHKRLILENGRWESKKEPWMVVDENNKVHALLSMDSLTKMVENYREMEEEALALRLEKSILAHVPIDFNDVWTVVMEELKKYKKVPLDLDKVVVKVKKEHHNLFLNLSDFLLSQGFDVVSSLEHDKG